MIEPTPNDSKDRPDEREAQQVVPAPRDTLAHKLVATRGRYAVDVLMSLVRGRKRKPRG